MLFKTWKKKKGGGVTARNLKLIEYLEKKNHKNFILSLKSRANNNSQDGFIDKNRNNFLNYINERFPLPFPNIFKIAKLVKNADVVHLYKFLDFTKCLCIYFLQTIF